MVANLHWNPEELKTVRQYYGTRFNEEIAMLLPGRSSEAIAQVVKRLGLSTLDSRRKLNGKRHRKYTCDDAYFSKPLSLFACYWAGFLAADGYVEQQKSYVMLSLHEKDKQHLEQFVSDINFTGPILRQREYIWRITIYSNSLVHDLSSHFNVVQAKSLTLLPPDLVGDQALAFIKGYIDGDGCIGYYANHGTSLSIEIDSTPSMIDWICHIFKTEVDHSGGSKLPWGRANPKKNSKIHKFIVRNQRAERIRRRILQMHLPGLDRKWLAQPASCMH